MAVAVQQQSFSAGLLDRSFRGRLDIKAYYAGCETALNLIPLPIGGMVRRPGTAWCAEIAAAATGCRIARFQFSTQQAYLIAFVHQQIAVFKDGELVASITSPYTAAQLDGLDWVQSLDSMILVHEDHAPRKLMRQGSHTAWDLSVIALANVPSFDFGSGSEPVWSATRGWPRTVCLHQGRLYFGGSKARPQTIWGSKANEYFDFYAAATDPLDDEAVEATLDSDEVNDIRGLISNRGLVILTGGTPWVVEGSASVTPGSFLPAQYAKIPAAAVRPIVVDGNVVFASAADDQRVRQSVYELAWDDGSQTYVAQDLALRCPELIQRPVDLAARYGNDGAAASQLYAVQGDGSVAVLTPNRMENITAWSRWQTDGQFLRCAVVGNTPYFLVRRTIAGTPRYFIERLDSAYRTDCAVRRTAASPTTIWPVSHLNGAEVRIIAAGHLQPPVTVSANLAVAAETATEAEIGLTYGWALQPMPLEAQLSDGTLIGHRYRPIRTVVRLQDTSELWVDGRRQSFRTIGDGLLDQTLPTFTGLHSVRLLGWQTAYAPLLQGFDPLPATILSITTDVAQ